MGNEKFRENKKMFNIFTARSEERGVAWIVAVGFALVFGMTARRKSFITFFAT